MENVNQAALAEAPTIALPTPLELDQAILDGLETPRADITGAAAALIPEAEVASGNEVPVFLDSIVEEIGFVYVNGQRVNARLIPSEDGITQAQTGFPTIVARRPSGESLNEFNIGRGVPEVIDFQPTGDPFPVAVAESETAVNSGLALAESGLVAISDGRNDGQAKAIFQGREVDLTIFGGEDALAEYQSSGIGTFSFVDENTGNTYLFEGERIESTRSSATITLTEASDGAAPPDQVAAFQAAANAVIADVTEGAVTVFEAQAYASAEGNEDLAAAFGTDEGSLLNHFLTFGFEEFIAGNRANIQ